MCLFITAVVPQTALTDGFAAIVKRHRLSFRPCANAHLQSQLRASERYLFATASYCDCGSPLFFAPGESRPSSRQSTARRIDKLRRKGWGEARIQDWLKATAPRKPDPNATQEGQRSTNEWSTFLQEVLSLPNVSYVGLVGHSYSGDVVSDEFLIADRRSHTVADLAAGSICPLPEDVVHEFRLPAGR